MKNCKLCRLRINTKKEKYVHVEDWIGDKIEEDMWCHRICFKKAMNKNLTELEKKAGMMLNVAGNIFNKIDPNSFKEEYVVK